LRLAPFDRGGVEVRPPVALRLKVDGLVVAEPSESERAGAAHPGVVVLMIQNFGLAGGRIDQKRPTVLVVGRAGKSYGVFAVLRPLRVEKLHVAFALLRPLPRALFL